MCSARVQPILFSARRVRSVHVHPDFAFCELRDGRRALGRYGETNYPFMNQGGSNMIRSIRLGVYFISIFSFAFFSVAQEDESSDEDENDASATDDAAVEQVVVTGTRLDVPDPTLRVTTISFEDLQKRGITTVEEAVRSIPQTLATFSNQTSREFGDDTLDDNLGAISAIGLSTANLSGFGSKNTLVLLNGKRLAGAAGNENFFVNLRDIPAAAIDRIEVNLSGGSSVYGADAVGGVINVITKTDYTGASVSLRNEWSNSGADQRRSSVFAGKSWEGGIAAVTLSKTGTDPVNNSKIGHTTRNLEPRTGVPEFNFLNEFSIKSAGVSTSRWGPFLTLGVGNDGRNAQPEDFRPIEESDFLDFVDEERAGETDDGSMLINIQHTFADRLTVQGEYLRTESHTYAQYTTFGIGSWQIPASNAFNNFGQTVFAQYNPYRELELGLVPPPEQTSRILSQRLVLAFSYAFTENTDVNFNFNVASSEAERHQWMIANREDDEFGDPATADRIRQLLASSDPNEAINFFGDGTGQNPTIRDLYVPYITSEESTDLGSYEITLRSLIRDFGIGEIPVLIGWERRPETYESSSAVYTTGLRDPERISDALFFEANFPLVTSANSRPWMKSFMITLKARYDSHEQEWTNEDNPGGTPGISTIKFSNVSPRIGFAWDLTDSFGLIGGWGAGFRAPSSSDMNLGSEVREFLYTYDPLCGFFGCAPPHPFVLQGNRNLKPEYSDNYEFGLDWEPEAVRRLNIQLTYNMTDFQDRIASRSELQNLLPLEEFANLPEFFERDAEGNLIRQYSYNINIARRVKQGLVLNVEKFFDLGTRGTLRNYLYVDYVIDMYDQASKGAEKASFVGESIGIDKYSLIGEVEWTRRNTSVFVRFDHTPGYTNNEWESSFNFFMVENFDVGSRTVFNVSTTYEVNDRWLLRAGADNIFNKGFPLSVSRGGTPFDARRVDLRGQVFWFDVQYDFGGRQSY